MLPRELIGNGQEQKWGEALLQCREKQMNSIYILELRSKDLSKKKKDLSRDCSRCWVEGREESR